MTKRIVQKIRGFIVRCFTNITLHKSTQEGIAEGRLAYKARYTEAMCHIDIIYLIDKRRWEWLGHVLHMSSDRNAHKTLNLLDFKPGSLLHHLPSCYHNLNSAIELASDRKKLKDVFDKRI